MLRIGSSVDTSTRDRGCLCGKFRDIKVTYTFCICCKQRKYHFAFTIIFREVLGERFEEPILDKSPNYISSFSAHSMVRLSVDVINGSLSYLNPLRERELDLRGTPVQKTHSETG